ncbi:MAG: DeoR family transcriptional regulator [Hyphomicrobiales bacterium]|nr:MAG: DeoR family transcriptional regulator [Hyphomicrobiales bacterium]
MVLQRHNDIIEIAQRDGRVLVDDLASHFRVTPQTIRKDLNDLCEQGLLQRTHGGALIASSVHNVGYNARQVIARDAKKAIGKLAAEQIPNDCSLLINIGTTTEEVAKALRKHQGLLVITNNINVANILRPYPSIEVIIASGVVRHSDGGIVGDAAVEFIRRFKVDYAVIGTSAIDADGALLDYDYREVSVSRAIVENARHVILVADSTKFDRTAPVRIGHLSHVHTFVTDQIRDERIRMICRTEDVAAIEADGDGVVYEPEIS